MFFPSVGFHGPRTCEIFAFLCLHRSLSRSAHRLFGEIPHRDEKLESFRRIYASGEKLTRFAICTAINSCTKSESWQLGRQIHSHVIKIGLEHNLFLSSALVDFYAKSGAMLDAREVFDGLTQHDQVSWTSMISGLSRNGDRKGALLMFKRMLVSSVKPNCQTFVGVMSGKTGPEEALVNATMLHAQIVKRGFESNSFLISTLVDVYSKCGRLGQAEVLFYDTEEKEEVLFNPMISGYCFNARYEKGLRLFAEMRERNLSPSYHAVTSALHACGSITLLQQGREIHALLIKLGSEFNIYVVSALVDMYSKCGSVEEARRAFDQTVEKNAVMWTSMILGYAQNGKGLNALELFKIWKKECDFRPDHVSFTAVLSACVHSGLVEKGLEYFGMFKNVYGIVPDQDHYACLVDLYARNGQLEKAKELMETMPQKPNHFMWSSFLSSCRDYGEIEIAKKTADKILLTETRDASSYIVLANLYASAGLWGEAAEVTRSMNEHKIKKNVSAGSWV